MRANGWSDSCRLAASTARSSRARATRSSRRSTPYSLVELVADVVQEQVVEVVAAELGVAVAGQHLDDAALGLDDGHVERAAAEVVDEEPLGPGLRRVVGQGGGGRLVEDADDLQPGELAGLAGGLPLGVVEVRRDGDDRLADRLPEFALGPASLSRRRIMAEISCGRYVWSPSGTFTSCAHLAA